MMHLPPNAFAPVTRPSRATKLRALAAKGWQAYLGWLSRQAVRRALSQLDDRMLKDIGICRGEIEGIARGKRPDRVRPERCGHHRF
jgi:uncharacterized protein YjiS (DUF1127 family)